MKKFIDADCITESDLACFLEFCDSNLNFLCKSNHLPFDSALYGLLRVASSSISMSLNHVDEFKK